MSLIVTDSGTKKTQAPPGSHLALCVQVIDLGTLYSKFYDKESHKVLIGWELPNEPNDDDEGKPFLVWNRYTASLNEKATLRGHLESWRGRKFTSDELKAFNLSAIVGKPCMLNVVHNDEGYANVTAVMAIPKGTNYPATSHPTVFFDIDNWDDEIFSTFGDGLKKTILGSKEGLTKFPHSQQAKAATKQTPPVGGNGHTAIDESEIPFDPQFSITMS